MPRDHATDLPKKVRALGLSARSRARPGGKLVVLDEATLAEPKTKTLAGALGQARLGLGADHHRRRGRAQFRAGRAQPADIDVLPAQGLNVYDILRRDTLVLTQDARQIEERLA